MSSVSKSMRLIHVLETVADLRLAIPSEVLQRVAIRTGSDPNDSNLKRNVYRDLRELSDQGRLCVKYLTPDGSEISPDEADTHKNIRIEYTLPENTAAKIQGSGLIEELGGAFVPSALRSLNWRFCSVDRLVLDGFFSLIFEGKMRKLVALQIPVEQVPAGILISRAPEGHSNFQPFAKALEKANGTRTAALLTWDRSVSRYDLEGGRLGHCLLTIDSNYKLKLTDLASSSGTFSTPMWPAQIENLERCISAQKSQSTLPLLENPLAIPISDPRINEETTLDNASLLQVGNFRFLALLKEP